MNDELFMREICPQCQSARLKRWNELTDEQKFLVERLPLSATFPLEQRKKHRFCTRCRFEEFPSKSENI